MSTAVKTRFLRQTVMNELHARYENLRKLYKFDENKGWVQVENSNTERKCAYGAFDMLRDLMHEWEE